MAGDKSVHLNRHNVSEVCEDVESKEGLLLVGKDFGAVDVGDV